MVRVLTERRCVAPRTLDDGDDCYDGNSVRTLSYHKLPQTRMRLSVLKLDGSLFDVHIGRSATVAELRQAIEEVFTLSPTEGQGKISWSHVWGHFCLCYDGQKLVNDKTRIQDFRIKDGDQLQFSRYMSIDYLHSKRRSKTQSVPWQPRLSVGSDTCEEKHVVVSNEDNLENQHKRPSSRSDAHEARKHSLLADKDSLGNQDVSHEYYQHEDPQEEIPVTEFKLVHFLRGWLPFSKFRGVSSRKTTEGRSRPSRFGMQYLLGTT